MTVANKFSTAVVLNLVGTWDTVFISCVRLDRRARARAPPPPSIPTQLRV
eukprot:SAG31_NODE_1830_length_7152_cov_2.148306_3_plen_50_part_00